MVPGSKIWFTRIRRLCLLPLCLSAPPTLPLFFSLSVSFIEPSALFAVATLLLLLSPDTQKLVLSLLHVTSTNLPLPASSLCPPNKIQGPE